MDNDLWQDELEQFLDSQNELDFTEDFYEDDDSYNPINEF
jgi:hypothetical protein